jgi:hypothetical protein
LFHIGQGLISDPVIAVIRSQQREKVDPAFTVRTAEPGEKVVTDMGDRSGIGWLDS